MCVHASDSSHTLTLPLISTEDDNTVELTAQGSEPLRRTTLLTLPPELRNLIYELALLQEDPIQISTSNISERTAFLRACKQIRREARAIFYANAFRILWDRTTFHAREDLFAFLARAGRGNVVHIPALTLEWPEITELSRDSQQKTQQHVRTVCEMHASLRLLDLCPAKLRVEVPFVYFAGRVKWAIRMDETNTIDVQDLAVFFKSKLVLLLQHISVS